MRSRAPRPALAALVALPVASNAVYSCLRTASEDRRRFFVRALACSAAGLLPSLLALPVASNAGRRLDMGGHVASPIPGTNLFFVDLLPKSRKNDRVSPSADLPVRRGRTIKPGAARSTPLAAKRAPAMKRAASAPAVDLTIEIDMLPFHTTSTKSGAPPTRRRVLQIIDLQPRNFAQEDVFIAKAQEAGKDYPQVVEHAAQEHAPIGTTGEAAEDASVVTTMKQPAPGNPRPRDLLRTLRDNEVAELQRVLLHPCTVKYTTGEGALGEGFRLSGDDFRRLGVGGQDVTGTAAYLNDNLMNAYACLLNKRSATLSVAPEAEQSQVRSAVDRTRSNAEALVSGGRRKTHIFSTYFYSKLTTKDYSYADIRRWTKVRVLDYGKLLFPVNIHSNHWVLAAVDVKFQRLVYMDPLHGGDKTGVLKRLRSWFFSEVRDKYDDKVATSLEIDKWQTVVNPPYMPHQRDGNSCGIFTLLMADYIELGLLPDFTQADIPVLRQRTALALHKGELPLA